MLKRSPGLDLMFRAGGAGFIGQLAEPLDMTLSAAAQHLKVLELCGLVLTRKVGRRCICELDRVALHTARRWLTARLTDRLAKLTGHLAGKVT